MEEEAIAGGQWNRVKDCEKRFLPFARKFRFVKIEFETADGIFMGKEATDYLLFFWNESHFRGPRHIFFTRLFFHNVPSFLYLSLSFPSVY